MKLGGKASEATKAKQSAAGKRRYGDPIARFWSHVIKDGPIFQGEPCWLWRNSAEAVKRDKNQAYGHLNWNGKYSLAHRVSLEIHGIAIPPHLIVDHMCRRPYCVNPAHLRFVTHAVNALENNDTPFSRNKGKEHCHEGHPFVVENLAIGPARFKRGNKKFRTTRVCLTCRPNMWMYSVIERKPPTPRCRAKWRGPFKPE